jgi:VanZ family protein
MTSVPAISSSFFALLKRWSPAVLMMALIFMFSSIPSDAMPDFGVYDLGFMKVGHLVGYGLLAVAFLRGLGSYTLSTAFLAWLLSVIYAGTDEFHQSFVPGRNAALVDIAIDATGAGLGLLIAAAIRKVKSQKMEPGE